MSRPERSEGHSVQLSADEVLVLGEYFNRVDETESMAFVHAAEYLALQRIAAQIDKTTKAFFSPDYPELLREARSRVSQGFEGDVPGLPEDT